MIYSFSFSCYTHFVPGLGTSIIKEAVLYQQDMIASFLFWFTISGEPPKTYLT